MTESLTERSQEVLDPVFFGLLEGLCFLGLFFSPWLSPAEPFRAWLAVALLRLVVLTLVLPWGSGGGGGARLAPWAGVREVFRLLAHALLYQIPFWVSALFFPLQSGQSRWAVTALGLQLALMAVLGALACWGRALCGPETVVFLLSLGWVALGRPLGWVWLLPAALGLLGTLPLFARKHELGSVLTSRQALAVGLAWFAGFALPALGPDWVAPTGMMLVLWTLILYLGAMASLLQRVGLRESEVLASLSCPRAGLQWLAWRRGTVTVARWLGLPLLLAQRPQDGVAWLLLLGAWWHGLALSARGWFNPDRLLWWAAAELTLVWLAWQGTPEGSLLVLGCSLLVGLGLDALVRRPSLSLARSEWQPSPTSALEQRLSLGLRLPAPADFSERLRAEMAPVELDKDLAAQAPAGFRQRLLERLRQSEELEE